MPQFRFCTLENALAALRQVLATAIDVEGEHRKRRAIGIGFSPLAPLPGALQRRSDPFRIGPGEDAFIKVERVALARHTHGPAAAGCAAPAAFARSAARLEGFPLFGL